LCGRIIISPPVPSCSNLYPVFCRGERPLAPTIFQTSDVSKTSDVFWQGERCLFQMHFIEQGDFRHRMSGRHPMSNQNEFGLGNEIGFGIIISRRGQIIISPIVPACSTLYPVLRMGDQPVAHTIFQTSDVSKTSDVFWQGGRNEGLRL